ncbi:MAG: hypothetical protein QM788_01360 [Roseateles sp.]|uniref:hypothetical protein n=1 Tax=Roseateles sp. TaxID=1971397 RepID=UPI0039ED6F95
MSTPPSSAPVGAAHDTLPAPTPAQWADIVQQLGAEIAGPLSAALAQIQALAATGPVDRHGLRLLQRPPAPPGEAAGPQAPDSLAWRLLEQAALALGVPPLREQEDGITRPTLPFHPLAADDAPPPDSTHARLQAEARRLGGRSRPLAGCQLLILAASRDLCAEAQAAVRHMGLLVDAVASVAEAAQFCREGLPHVLLFDAALRDDALRQLIAGIVRDAPDVAFVEMFDREHRTQPSTATGDGLARISRRHLPDALPPLLMAELSRRLRAFS